MQPTTLLVWILALPPVLIGINIIFVSIREKKPRAAVVGGTLFGTVTLVWCALLILLPDGHFTLSIGYLASTAIVLAALFFPLGKHSSKPPFPTERFDERCIMFARARYSRGDARYETFYEDHPELKEVDDRIRELPHLGQPGSLSYDHINAPIHNALFEFIDRIRDTADGPVAGKRVDITPENASARLKGLALALGAASVGTTAVHAGHVYSRIGRGSGEWGASISAERHPYALVFAVEMDAEMIGGAPLQPAVVDSSRQYVEAAKIAMTTANYIRHLGWPARAHIDGNYRLILPQLAADAGLGEVGRLSLLIIPEHGPRVRLGAVTTLLPLAQDEPKTFGVEDFCNRCLKCARNCPAQAIPEGGKAEIRGTSYWKTDPEGCFGYWLRAGSDCGLCIAVCPYSHPKAFIHSFVRAACSRSSLSRSLFSRADDLFYGSRPIAARYPEWMKAGMPAETAEKLRIR